jgi:hypothetical protein
VEHEEWSVEDEENDWKVAVHGGDRQATENELVLSQVLRALELRFQDFEIQDPNKPLLARDGDRTYRSMPLPPNQALPPRADAVKESTAPVLSQETTSPAPSKAMVPVGQPRKLPIVVPTDSNVPVPANNFDILGEAEGLREGLFKVATHADKILRFLRGVCTQQKLFDFARTSLLALGNQSSTGVKRCTGRQRPRSCRFISKGSPSNCVHFSAWFNRA